ncbi:hypothetical protein [Marinoscillum furvescens]|uniref:Sulfotransferase family protein n=1 Tax=Marinoscillum furvescens DSM 4134 TaxID=1122208 RepID=A0A3D9KWA5_MARFU|nr:hypothetical protein [Marinoscillum furvescens]RED92306.1 hypothetical protein C7460_13120 [Marinoscillum furvescens DSM 4134]
MISSPHFVWTHFAKTGGYTVHKVIEDLQLPDVQLDPLGGEWSDYRRHEPFWLRSQKENRDITANKLKILTFRRLPSWLLSFAEFKKREEGFDFEIKELAKGYFKHEKRDMTSGALDAPGSYEQHHADEALAYYHPESIDVWWTQERLIPDMLDTLGRFYTIPSSAYQWDFQQNSNSYNRSISDRFSRNQLEELYHNCPLWTAFERKIYGSLLV